MKSLIVPMAGRSTRFPNTRPKFLLTHPKSGDLMCVESLKGINLEKFDRIYFTFLKEHDEKYRIKNGLAKCLENNGLLEKSSMLAIEESASQSETVYKTIKRMSIEGSFMVKDSDSYFTIKVDGEENQIAYMNLKDVEEIKPIGKSYIEMGQERAVTNIVEKKVVSDNFCVGGYGFKSAADFCRYYESITDWSKECYISDVIFEMLLAGESFFGNQATSFTDWGTERDWNKYCSGFSTLFVDLDGTLITNTSEYIYPYTGDGEPICENIQALKEKSAEGKCTIVITTARPEKFRDLTVSELKRHGVPYDQLVMGLPHCRRYLINDYAATNGYPTAVAVNIERNSKNLKNLI